MKASVQAGAAAAAPEGRVRPRAADLLELTKPRITAMVAVTTGVGFYLGSPGPLDVPRLLHTLVGTALVASAAGGLNQVVERDLDARMRRTEMRPIPARRVSVEHAAFLSTALAVAGIAELALFVGLLTAALALACLAIYVAVYTPLKTRTTLNTLVGAVAGAVPPVMGWTGASGSLSTSAALLFGILFLWQLPHFYAIAWMYREDYARAGFRMLPVVDPSGARTAFETVLFTVALIVVAALPSVVGLTGVVYLVGSLALGLLFFAVGVQMARRRTRPSARQLLLASVLYLPLLLGLLVLDKNGSVAP